MGAHRRNIEARVREWDRYWVEGVGLAEKAACIDGLTVCSMSGSSNLQPLVPPQTDALSLGSIATRLMRSEMQESQDAAAESGALCPMCTGSTRMVHLESGCAVKDTNREAEGQGWTSVGRVAKGTVQSWRVERAASTPQRDEGESCRESPARHPMAAARDGGLVSQ